MLVATIVDVVVTRPYRRALAAHHWVANLQPGPDGRVEVTRDDWEKHFPGDAFPVDEERPQ